MIVKHFLHERPLFYVPYFIAIGAANTGIYGHTGSVVIFSVSGGAAAFIDAAGIAAYGASAGFVRNTSASDTNPTLCPDRGDTNTGIGRFAADNLSLIAGGAELTRLAADSIQVKAPLISTKYQSADDFDQEASGVLLDAGLNKDFWTPGGTNYAAANLTYQAGVIYPGVTECKGKALSNYTDQ